MASRRGRCFCGESMFSRQENASKTALLVFCAEFIRHGGKLIDCQVLNSHTASLGAIEIPRRDYLDHLAALRQQPLASRFLGAADIIFAPEVNVSAHFLLGVL
ncbi:leucyl/phenylalanyl-tRNA-protein transferase [Salmonella enterica subsp. enterica]|nr:leucyl/phenylalanyl-tRNA-protein transferase [Salmonella enterica subsp. enterica]